MRIEWFRPPGGGEAVLRLPLAVSPWAAPAVACEPGDDVGATDCVNGLQNLARRPEPSLTSCTEWICWGRKI